MCLEPGSLLGCLPKPQALPTTPSSPCRVFLALVEDVEDRGTIVAQGGGKVSQCAGSLWGLGHQPVNHDSTAANQRVKTFIITPRAASHQGVRLSGHVPLHPSFPLC